MRLPYIYHIVDVVKVTDGDSFWVRVDVGFRQWALVNIRLLGYDTPEMRSSDLHERNQARIALAVTERFLTHPDGPLWVRTEKDPDNFGRWLGDIWQETPDGDIHLGDMLARHHLASEWPQRWRDRYGENPP